MRRTKKPKPYLQRCDGCGAQKMAAGPVWCECNPSAKWRMTPVSIGKAAARAVGDIAHFIRKGR